MAAAAFSDPLPRGTTDYASTDHLIPYGYTEVFGRATSLSWSTDRGFLIAAIVLAFLSLGTYFLASRTR